MITENKIIDRLLENYKDVIKRDYIIYRNHVYRIFNYAVLLDVLKENHEKYAIAAVYHDLGICTHSFDYLAPSIELSNTYLKANNRTEWIDEISLMIDNHHKKSSYKGAFQNTVEVFRRADWIDVTKGRKLFGLEKSNYKAVQLTFLNTGFHFFLMKQFLKYFIKHPLNPLPMFKK